MSSEARPVSLELDHIRTDGGTQIREKIDRDVVEEYAERMDAGAAFKRAIVFFDGQNYWLADGFHRLEARRLLKHQTLDCLAFDGRLRDAILYAVQANSTHGLRRTNNDKRRAVETVLADEEWSKNSNRWIAQTCGVGRSLVDDVRRQLADSANKPMEGDAVRVGQDGKLRPAHRTARAPDHASDPIEAALRCGEAFDACILQLRRVQAGGERLAQGPGGKFFNGIRLADFRMHLDRAVNAIAATPPSGRCGRCNGAGCECCEQAGWLCPGKQRLH